VNFVVENVSLSDVGLSFFAKFVEFHAVMFRVRAIVTIMLWPSEILCPFFLLIIRQCCCDFVRLFLFCLVFLLFYYLNKFISFLELFS